MGMLKKVERVRIFDQAVVQLRTAILDGQYLPGSRLPTEQELCEVMEVGRSTIREAMRVLEAEGLIQVRRGSGAYVTGQLNPLATRGEILGWMAQRKESVLQILEVRESIEWLTTSLAATAPTPELVDQLQEIVRLQKEECDKRDGEPDIDALADLDIEFHLAISEAGGNDIAHEIVTHVVPAFSDANRAFLWAGQGGTTSIEEHQAIVDAIASGNQSAAEKAMREHIVRVRDDIRAYLGQVSEE